MWLLPAFSLVSNLAARTFYRFTVAGASPPRGGPVLLVANHPNSLFDPVFVVAAARRPVRFLAKAPLFSDRLVGWIVRGAGAIPVYRRVDDPSVMGRNEDMFRAAFQALEGGAAVGIFPEGVSHSEPSLVPLKTGVARIALGAAAGTGDSFPVVPVGLVHRAKETFRSEAHVVLGSPVAWTDLAPRGPDDVDAVRMLTERINAALRRVTLNLEAWEDRPLVETVEAIWSAELRADRSIPHQIERLDTVTSILRRVRHGDTDGHPLVSAPGTAADPDRLIEDILNHRHHLAQLGLEPSDLAVEDRLRTGVKWAIRRFYLVNIPVAVIAALGLTLFWIPYRVTGMVANAMRPDPDQESTYKLLVGIAAYGLWVALLAVVAGWRAGPVAAAVVAVSAPLVGMVGLWIKERWHGAWRDVRRFFLVRGRRRLIEGFRDRQRSLMDRLRAVQEATAMNPPPPGAGAG